MLWPIFHENNGIAGIFDTTQEPIWYFWQFGFLSSSRLATSAFLNAFVSEIERKQKSQYLIAEIFAFRKEPFITREPLKAIKEDETELLVLMCITNK